MGSQVDINSCTDACTHSEQGVDHNQGDWDTHTVTNRETQVSMKLCLGLDHAWAVGGT